MKKATKEVSLLKAIEIHAGKNLYANPKKYNDSMKTMKCGILTEQKFKQAEHIHLLTENQKEELDIYIDTFEEKKKLVLNDFYRYYEKGVFDFLIHCARIKDTDATRFERIKEIRPVRTNIKKGNGEYLKVKAYRGIKVKDESIHKRLYWVAEDMDTDDGCYKVLLSYSGRKEIKKDENGNERITYKYINSENYEGHRFDKNLFSLDINSQSLSNRLSFFYFTTAQQKDKDGKRIHTAAYKKYLNAGIEIKGILDGFDLGQQLKDALRTKIAATLTSFAAKLTDTIEVVENVFIEKDRLLDFLFSGKVDFTMDFIDKISKSHVKVFEKLIQLTMKEGDLKEISNIYNYQAKECNVIINLIIRAYLSNLNFDDIETSREEFYKQLRDEFLLPSLKAIPSFPGLKDGGTTEVTTDDIFIFINTKKEKISLDVFSKMKLDLNDYEEIEKLNELAARLKWPVINKGSETSIIFLLHKLLMRKRNNIAYIKLYKHAYYLIINNKVPDAKEIIENLIDFAIVHMRSKANHLNEEKYKSDGQTKRIFSDYARIIVSFLSVAQKKMNKLKTARKLELEIDELLGNFKGSAFDSLKRKESDVLGLSGFGFAEKAARRGAVLVFKNVNLKLKNGKNGVLTCWYLGLNLYKTIKFKEDNIINKKFQEYDSEKFYALCSKKGETPDALAVKELDKSNFLENPEMLLLPLMLGKRQIRGYFTNFKFSVLDQGTFFNSLEIQRITEGKKASYFLNLVVTRQKIPLKTLPPEYQKGVLGVKRGENTVAWAALLDMDGNPLFADPNKSFMELAPEFGKKYRKRYKEFQESQSRGSVKRLNVKGEIEKIIEQTGARIVTEALQHGLKIVLENLDASFGRKGKGVFAGVSKQYNNLQTFIESKLSQNNISMNRVDGLLTYQFPAYDSILCSCCGNINSLNKKEHLIKDIIALNKEGELPKELKYKKWNINLDQNMKKWDGKKRKYVEIIFFEEIVNILTNNRITKKEFHIENQLRDLLNPRKEQSGKFKCAFCGHECNADKQASLNIARFTLLPKRTVKEKEKISYLGKIELEYQKRLKSGFFIPGSEFL